MRVLLACERSARVRDEFTARGHYAVSCDIHPSETPGPHIRGDVLPHLDLDWDLIIAFPPCTHLSASGARWFPAKRADGRQAAAIDFFMAMISAPAPLICVENPIGIMSTEYQRPDQIIQPWQFGHDASKATCLWLTGLRPLRHTKIVQRPPGQRYSNQSPCGANNLPPSPDRARLRSLTYPGIARAMATQWSESI